MKPMLGMLIAALVLAGCATAPAPERSAMAARAPAGAVVMGTLALWGTWEMEIAPYYTRLALARHQAAARLRDGRIDLSAAVAVQAEADEARQRLDQSRAAGASGRVEAARDLLTQAAGVIDSIEATLGARR